MQKYDLIIDASGLRLGRMASYVAKQLLNGKRVAIINCEKAVISGSKKDVLRKYLKRLEIRGQSSPEKGPRHVRRPDRIVWRAIRGMLPKKKWRGKDALRRVKIFIGRPEWVNSEKVVSLDEFHYSRLRGKFIRRYVTIEWLSYQLGYRGLSQNV